MIVLSSGIDVLLDKYVTSHYQSITHDEGLTSIWTEWNLWLFGFFFSFSFFCFSLTNFFENILCVKESKLLCPKCLFFLISFSAKQIQGDELWMFKFFASLIGVFICKAVNANCKRFPAKLAVIFASLSAIVSFLFLLSIDIWTAITIMKQMARKGTLMALVFIPVLSRR